MSEHLYIHVPFCLKKCRYCDFYSETDLSRVSEYVSSLEREIALRSEAVTAKTSGILVKTIYFGGGTPSVLPLSSLEAVMDSLHRNNRVSPDAEITLEANPGTLESSYLKGLAGLGINRLSLGIQSFDDDRLALLGRIHTRNQAEKAIDAARNAGFDNLGLDLIYGLPGETMQEWERQMEAALAFDPEHLSCYMLTLEPGTPLYRQYENGQFVPMAGDAQVDLFGFTSQYLTGCGYDHYEISNFAKGREHRSRHNCAYWEMTPYTGFGPSAHSYGVQPGEGAWVSHIRFWNHDDLGAYIRAMAGRGGAVKGKEILTQAQQMLEWIMVGLRTQNGVDITAFNRLSPVSFQDHYSELIQGLEGEGLGRTDPDGKTFALTLAGWTRLDNILESFARHLPSDPF